MNAISFQATGNLTTDPELTFTTSGKAVANLTVAVTPRTRNAAGSWVDGETTFLRGAAWESLAENVAESLTRGARVNVTGTLRSRSYETKEGEKRTVLEATFETVAPDLRFATARVTKASRSGGRAQQSQAPANQSQAPANEDPWNQPQLTREEYQAQMQGLRPDSETPNTHDAAVQSIASRLGGTPVEPPF
jgi:single-strand DNA-binding protein